MPQTTHQLYSNLSVLAKEIEELQGQIPSMLPLKDHNIYQLVLCSEMRKIAAICKK